MPNVSKKHTLFTNYNSILAAEWWLQFVNVHDPSFNSLCTRAHFIINHSVEFRTYQIMFPQKMQTNRIAVMYC